MTRKRKIKAAAPRTATLMERHAANVADAVAAARASIEQSRLHLVAAEAKLAELTNG